MDPLANWLLKNEEWLLARIVEYARSSGYLVDAPNFEEAWRIGIAGFTGTLISLQDSYLDISDSFNLSEFILHPAVAFCVRQAQLHRARGIELSVFLGLLKIYRQCYLDGLARANFSRTDVERYQQFLYQVFDRLELASCLEWTSRSRAGVLQDLRTSVHDLAQEKNKYLVMFENLPFPVLLFSETLELDYYNQTASILFGDNQTSGAGYYQPMQVENMFPWLPDELKGLIDKPEEEILFEKKLLTLEGPRHFQVRLTRISDIAKQILGIIVVLFDITELRNAEEQVRYLGAHDGLTGVYNRGFFEEELDRLRRGRQFPVSIMVIDIDDLQSTNDTLGHGAGDELLRRAANLLRGIFRAEDLLARFGGDQFAVLLPGVDARTLKATRTRLGNILGIENHRNQVLPLSLCVGSATATQSEMLMLALQQAEEEMQQEKQKKPRTNPFTARPDQNLFQ